MFIAVVVAAMFSMNTAEFRELANQQMSEGYEWHYVGKQKPSGVPAITIKPENGDQYILYKLKK